MDIKLFKKLYKKYSKFPLSKEVSATPEHEEYIEATINNKECEKWLTKQHIKKAGIDHKKYCCLHMAYYLTEDKKKKRGINYDSVIIHTAKRKKFGSPIHDGGSSFIMINYCPWCSATL